VTGAVQHQVEATVQRDDGRCRRVKGVGVGDIDDDAATARMLGAASNSVTAQLPVSARAAASPEMPAPMTATRRIMSRAPLRARMRLIKRKAARSSGFLAEERREAPPKERGREEGGEEPLGDFSRRPASRREWNRFEVRLDMPRERGPVVLFRSGYDTLSALEFHPFPRLFRDVQAFVTALTERVRT